MFPNQTQRSREGRFSVNPHLAALLTQSILKTDEESLQSADEMYTCPLRVSGYSPTDGFDSLCVWIQHPSRAAAVESAGEQQQHVTDVTVTDAKIHRSDRSEPKMTESDTAEPVY